MIKDAPRRSTPRADAMWNLAILKLDFMEDLAGQRQLTIDREGYERAMEGQRVVPGHRERSPQ